MEPKGKGMEHPGGERAARVERLTEMPMLLLALAFVPASIIGNLPSLYAESHVNAAKFVEYAIVAAFAAELLARLAVAERPLE